jgi:rare lipoprotein A
MLNEWFNAARRISRGLALVALASSVAGCVATNTTTATAPPRGASDLKTVSLQPARPRALHDVGRPHSTPLSVDGLASYYWEGARVATGAKFDPNGLTAAHRSLPFGTRLRVSDPKTRRSVIVTINDRGPFIQGRVLDLSLGAARVLGIESRGVSHVHGDVL